MVYIDYIDLALVGTAETVERPSQDIALAETVERPSQDWKHETRLGQAAELLHSDSKGT